jgi:dipeptidyl aminopeptidase/acylaminoacyl peptidase
MTEPIRSDLFRHLKTVGDPTVAPDGSRCAYVLSWIDQETSEPRARVYQAALHDAAADGTPRPFTQGNNDGHPRFSPDGATLAFLRPGSKKEVSDRQVWLMPAAGGEAFQLTDLPNGVREFTWSPDSARLAVVSDVSPTGRSKESDLPVAPDVPVAKEVNRIRYRHDAIGWRGDNHFHLFMVDAASGKWTQLTDGDWDDMAPAWSPDGGRIAFISGRSDSRDKTAAAEVYVVDVPDKVDTDRDVPVPVSWSEGLTDAAAVAWAPDGERLLAAGGTGDGLMVLWQAYLYVLRPAHPPRQLTDDTVRPCLGYPGIFPPLELRWTAGAEDDGRIVFLGDAEGQTRLYEMTVKPEGNTSPTPITAGNELLSGIAMDRDTNRVVITGSGTNTPSDAHLLEITNGGGVPARRRLTTHNDDWLAHHAPAPMEKFLLEREDWDIECRLYHPHGFDPAKRYPLILEVHGGPNGAFYDSFVPWHQVLAGAGYLTLAVNPRGSSTYGEDFVNAVLGDWGGDDYRDLMAAVDAVCQRDYVDTDRLGVHGYSYGGYMTTWMVGQTNRFRAAVAGAPCIDLWTMYGTSDIATSFGETQWAIRLAGGMPISRPLASELAEGVDALAYRLLQRSPIKFAPQVETPVLLLHGESDARCPIGQSEQYFQVLKRLDKEVEMVRFPGCGHGFLRTGHVALRQEYLQRMLDWFQRWL